MEETYTIIRDTREQKGWDFIKRAPVKEVIDQALPTGDYSLQGCENKFVIERKRNMAELSANLVDDRFYRELERMRSFEMAYILCEFPLDDVMTFPKNSGVPYSKMRFCKLRPPFLLSRIQDIELEYGVKIHFGGSSAKYYASGLFKKAAKRYLWQSENESKKTT